MPKDWVRSTRVEFMRLLRLLRLFWFVRIFPRPVNLIKGFGNMMQSFALVDAPVAGFAPVQFAHGNPAQFFDSWYRTVTCSESVLLENYRKCGIVWEMTSGSLQCPWQAHGNLDIISSSPCIWQSLVRCTILPRGVQKNLSLLGDDHQENVPESSAMLGSTVDTCSCVSPTMNLG